MSLKLTWDSKRETKQSTRKCTCLYHGGGPLPQPVYAVRTASLRVREFSLFFFLEDAMFHSAA